MDSTRFYSSTEERLPGGVASLLRSDRCTAFHQERANLWGGRDAGNMQMFERRGVGGKPGEPDSEKIKAYSSASSIIFGEGLGFFPLQYVTDNIFVIRCKKNGLTQN